METYGFYDLLREVIIKMLDLKEDQRMDP